MYKEWEYYNKALISTVEPHRKIEVSIDREFWKCTEGYPILARWTSDYDCKSVTNWWYVIKDDSLQIDKVKARYRYRIVKGSKRFETRIIDPMEYINELFEVYTKAYSSYPEKYRPKIKMVDFAKEIQKMSSESSTLFFGAIDRENGKLEGVLVNKNKGICHYLDSLRVNPECEKKEINAALVKSVLDYYNIELEKEKFRR